MGEPDRAADERLLATFLDLVRIDSPSKRESACAAYCAAALEAAGCSVRFDNSAEKTGSDTGNLIAEFPGTAPGTLVLSAHLDCVQPCEGVEPVIAGGIVTSAGETVLGADDKAGLAAAIECVRRLGERDGARPTVRCIFTVQEECGLCGAKALAPTEVAGDVCLVLDADGTPGGIVTGAPTHYTFTAEFIGRASHAGVQPEAGVSAILMAADAIKRMPAGRIDERTTANVGTVEGGTATNVIAGRCRLTGECRSRDRATVESVKAQMDAAMKTAASEAGGSVEIEWTLEYEGFDVDPADPMLGAVSDACTAAGAQVRLYATGGGSDANIFAAKGVPTFALSCGMQGVHGTDEQIAVADLETLARVCVEAADAVMRRKAQR